MVSICILNWNCIDVVKKTISLITEDLDDMEWEIIIYDQNSNDDSKNFLSSLNEENITTILSPKNVGNSISRNQMVKRAKYKYVLLLDSDIIPIKNSIKCMIEFMEENTDYGFLGYDYKSWTLNIKDITKFEGGIKQEDVLVWRDKVALSQYGLFKKSVLEEFNFPEFYPFDREGWGAEDDILGHLIHREGDILGGTIMNRVYYHQKSSSIPLLGQDNFQMLYMRRILNFLYFRNMLTREQQKIAIKNKTLPTTKLRCNKYFWKVQHNLGDMAHDWILSEFFPFLEFDENNKTNLLVFGGTVLNHIENANRQNSANYKNILFFGVGVSCQNELIEAKKMIEKNQIEYTIVARGPKTQSELTRGGLICKKSCGDVLQLFAGLPKIENRENSPELIIYDTYIKEQIKFQTSSDVITVKVAQPKPLNYKGNEILFYGLKQYLMLMENVSKVYSSQIHPPLISSLLGKPVQFYSKDWRIEDFKYFKAFSENMTETKSLDLRLEAQKNIIRFGELFFNNIKIFL